MSPNDLPFAGWPGGARALAPEVFARRDGEVRRTLDLLLDYFTPRSVFLDLGSPDCELAVRAAGFVERVWCVEAGMGLGTGMHPPCNLRLARLEAIEAGSVDVAFAAEEVEAAEVFRVLKPGGFLISRASRNGLKAAGFRLSALAFLPGRAIVARK